MPQYFSHAAVTTKPSALPLQPRRCTLTAFRIIGMMTVIGVSCPVFAADDKRNEAPSLVNAPIVVEAPMTPNFAAERNLAIAIERALGVPGIEVQVFIDEKGARTAVLSGNLGVGAESEAKSAAVAQRAAKLVPLVVNNVVSLVLPHPQPKAPSTPQEIAAAEEAKIAAENVTAIWTRTFTSNPVTSTKPGSEAASGGTGSSSTSRATELAATLNKLHGGDDKNVLITAHGPSTFYLRGPRSKVVDLKRDLLKIDAIWPQVQLDLWTVQVSGSPQTIAKEATRIRERFDNARSAMQMAQSLLGDAAQNPQFFDRSDPLLTDSEDDQTGWLERIGFDPNCNRPLSLTEALIFLGLQTALVDPATGTPLREGNGKTRFFQGQGQAWHNFEQPQTLARIFVLKQLQQKLADKFNDPHNKALLRGLGRGFKDRAGQADPQKLLPTLLAVYSSNPVSDRAGIKQFALATFDFRNKTGGVAQQESNIARLRAAAAASDRLLKAATDAFAADMQNMFLKPIFDEEAKRSGNSNSGTALTGQARLVVTSRVETGIAPIVTSYVDTTRPKPLGKEFLNDILGTGGGAPASTAPASTASASTGAAAPSTSSASGAAGLGTLFTHLSNPQLLLLGAVLNQPEPEITKVAPGVAINVRPTVLPDGGSARLQLDFNFGVQSTVENPVTTGDGRRKSVPADGIISNHVATDITVSAFDLFNVSSFSIESSHPRSRYLPVIGSIPIVGELIKKPRKNKVTRHESIVLVNTTILPRILDLAHFYGD